MMSARERVLAHLERLLGPVGRVTTGHDSQAGETAGFQVATFLDQPAPGAFTLATVGLSETPLVGPEGHLVRQELLLCGWNEHRSDRFYGALFSIAQSFQEVCETADPGAVLELPEPLTEAGGRRHFFVYDPVYHPEELSTVPAVEGEDGEEVEVLWLIPITEAEAELVEAEGPEGFELYLEQADPDLLDVGRPGEM